MSLLTMTTFVSLDGVIQGPGAPNEDTSGGFQYGGWVTPFFDDDGGAHMMEVFTRPEAFLLGRKTYEIFASYWPKVADPKHLIAHKLNTLPKYVASRTLQQVSWANSTLIKGDLREEVTAIKQKYSGEIQVHGSGDLARSLLALDLVDQLELLIFPVVLGAGRRLFGPGTNPTAFSLEATKVTRSGVICGTYRRAGRATFGTVDGS